MNTPTQQEVRNYLEGLVWSRMTEKELNDKLSEFFGEPIKVYNASKEREKSGDPDELADWNLMFNVIREDKYELFGDVYMLPTREVKDDSVVMYITEVGYDFC